MSHPVPSPAEQRATREDMPVVACASYEFFSALTGDPIVVRLLDGREVLLRLATVDEVLTFQTEAIEALSFDIRPELMSRERAADLVRPLLPRGGVQ